jgi:DNA-binding response OmpR family regulator
MPIGNPIYTSRAIPSLLVVEDYDKLRAVLGHHFERRGYRVYSVSRGKDAEAIAHSLLPQVILLDYDLAGEDALMIARHLQTILPGSKIIITGGPDNAMVHAKIEALDGVVYFPKTHELTSLDELIDATVDSRNVK